ncbi:MULTISPECIES: pyrroloquinoline quinone biosynthesis peptide chaperone PqqD [Hyphomicrobium]|uniref:pyrroloquinoline quinone biosynthesis peptide chaperone PqqD n=1 Tax=Hyphomicrobium TaxID=81 RepID=UPI0003813DF5|nr:MULTISPECIES: pyrroloquinoline quinone biosynthesis peptide chaperone PqqD [Hyphomicrobium]WBT36795.1 pyrroloquinoline quinone biosynthesis peptide chaperone PqqD [Hyphomicrobium sp. DMF-1]
MSETSEPRSMPTRLIVAGDTKLVLPRHIKLRHDPGRGRWIILAPERVFNPDDTAVEVLKRLDGQRSVSEIAEALSQEYQAPLEVVTEDILAMLQDLTDKGVLAKA